MAPTAASNVHAATTVTGPGKPCAATSTTVEAASATSATSATSASDLDHETVIIIGRKRGDRPGHLRSGGDCARNDHCRRKRRQRKSAR